MTTTLLALLLAGAPDAHACGGFFCDQGAPRDTQTFDPELPRVDQKGETIVFRKDDDGKVEVHVQVAYEGDVDEFSWIVPVPEQPDLFVSSQSLFDTLLARTQPTFQVRYETVGECLRVVDTYAFDADEADTGLRGGGFGGGSTTGGNGGGGQPPAVVVVDSSEVGPYDTVTLSATSASALLEWLEDNDYTVPPDAEDAIAGYLADGAFFVALKLRKGTDTGELVPLGMRYPGSTPQIPLTLTRIAAVDDMRLTVFLLGEDRAVPTNYLHVHPNLARLNWWTGFDDWEQLVTDAANEAGGQAFATEFADTILRNSGVQVWSNGWWDETALRESTTALAWLRTLRGGTVPSDPAVLDVLRRQIPLSALDVTPGTTDLDVYNCPNCYAQQLTDLPFSAEVATDDYATAVVEPLAHTHEVLSTPQTVTRLLSSMSPAEMTVDPVFAWNPILPAVRSDRLATIQTLCKPDITRDDAPMRMVLGGYPDIPLPSSGWMRQEGWSFETIQDALDDLPANLSVEQTAAEGEPQPILDNHDTIETAVLAWAESTFGLTEDDAEDPTDDEPEILQKDPADCGGCATGTAPAGWLLLGLAGLVARRRR